jgi:hypothetical protein
MIVQASWVTLWEVGLLLTQLLAAEVEEINVIKAEEKTVEKETLSVTGLIVQIGVIRTLNKVNGRRWWKTTGTVNRKKWKEIGINLNAKDVEIASLMQQLSSIQ